jgi:hypothetical protein
VKKLILVILSLLLTLASSSIRAELQLSSAPIDTQTLYKIKSVLRTFILGHSRDFRNGHSEPNYFTNDEGFGSSNFIWTFDGKKYISSIAAFVPDNLSVDSKSKGPANPHFRYQCHFFLLDTATFDVVAVAPLTIKFAKHKISDQPFCSNTLALSLAKVTANGILVVLGYGDSASPPDLRASEFDFSTTTLLMRLNDDSGTLKIEQDDSCLGNPNTYSSIGAARKALARCETKKAGQ